MHVSLINIGTSKGIRIPASILQEIDMPRTFDLRLERNSIVLDVVEEPRKGWAEKFADFDEEALVIDDVLDADAWDAI
jgi:antitoxin component of MazEF toxin-antitoxin module